MCCLNYTQTLHSKKKLPWLKISHNITDHIQDVASNGDFLWETWMQYAWILVIFKFEAVFQSLWYLATSFWPARTSHHTQACDLPTAWVDINPAPPNWQTFSKVLIKSMPALRELTPIWDIQGQSYLLAFQELLEKQCNSPDRSSSQENNGTKQPSWICCKAKTMKNSNYQSIFYLIISAQFLSPRWPWEFGFQGWISLFWISSRSHSYTVMQHECLT